MIENEMIDEAVKKFSDSKEASKYFISSLVTSWKFNSEYFFEDANKYLNFTYQDECRTCGNQLVKDIKF